MLDNRPVLNRREPQKKIRKNLAIARRKIEQILKDQVNNKTRKEMMAREHKIAGEQTKGKVDLVVSSFNAKSIKNKLAAFTHALGKRKIDVCVINELSVSTPPTYRG